MGKASSPVFLGTLSSLVCFLYLYPAPSQGPAFSVFIVLTVF